MLGPFRHKMLVPRSRLCSCSAVASSISSSRPRNYEPSFALSIWPWMAPRARFGGSNEAVQSVLEPFVTNVQFLSYDECTTQARIDTKEITRHKGMVQKLARLHNKLCFSQATMVGVLKEIQEQKKLSFSSTEEAKGWRTTMATRMRIMLRHIAQVRLKKANTEVGR